MDLNVLVIIVVAALAAAAVSYARARGAGSSLGKASPANYSELRDKALAGSRASFGLPAVKSSAEAWGVLMDIGFAGGDSYTTVAMSDGSASIYLSNGGGLIGGHAHEAIRKAAQEMVKIASTFQPQMKTTKSFPLPGGGETAFYVLTDSGVFTASASEEELGQQRHPLSPLFYAGQEVITQYRLIRQP